MLQGKHILAVVPARSGSKGIPNKNMQQLRGISLIGWAGMTLRMLPWLDARIISTDSPEYAREGQRYDLAALCLRPPHLSTDEAGAIETIQHALYSAEAHYTTCFDIILIIEPTSPLRLPEDIERAVQRLIATNADSVVSVSPLSSKSHPRKVLQLHGDQLTFFVAGGNTISGRQVLSNDLYWRNGICYALSRASLIERQVIFTEHTVADVITRPVVNIDEPIELEWADFLLGKQAIAVPN